MDANHITDDDLDRYLLNKVQEETELASMEEHILMCDSCAQRAAEADNFIQAIRDAAPTVNTSNVRNKGAGCPQRRRLERAVVAALEGVYRAHGDNRDEARLIESRAVIALEEHITVHGCGNQGAFARHSDTA